MEEIVVNTYLMIRISLLYIFLYTIMSVIQIKSQESIF